MRTLDFSPFYRSTVGFDRVFDLLDSATRLDASVSAYPPYNIEVTGEDAYRISIAVAGFGLDDLHIEMRENKLTVSGKHGDGDEKARYLHRGIAGRAFEREFHLADHVKVSNASLENGLLHVDLVREIPEEQRPRRIEITGGSGTKVIENKKAA